MRSINNRRTARLLSASALAIGLVAIAQPALAGIANSRHNLGNSGGGSNNWTSGTQELCVFCHTPHGSDTNAAAPLWNKYINPATTYQMYGTTNSATYDAINSPLPGGVSLACLTCHDGTQAMDNMLNAPGAGRFDSTGGGAGGLTTYTWFSGSSGSGASSTGVLLNTSARQPMLGTDLRNDHPVGMNYCASATNNIATPLTDCTDTDFAAGSTVGTRKYIDTGTAGFQKTDLPLYSTGSVTIKVECATCHDPHSTANATFLRTSNAGSALCLACHVK